MKIYKNEFNWGSFESTLVSAMDIPRMSSTTCPRELQTFVQNAMDRQLLPPLSMLDNLFENTRGVTITPVTLALQAAFFACSPYDRKSYWLAALVPTTLWKDSSIIGHLITQCDIETVVVAAHRSMQNELDWSTAQLALEFACQAKEKKDTLDLEATAHVMREWLASPERADRVLLAYEWTRRNNPARLMQLHLLLGCESQDQALKTIFQCTSHAQKGNSIEKWNAHVHWAYESGWIKNINDCTPALNPDWTQNTPELDSLN